MLRCQGSNCLIVDTCVSILFSLPASDSATIYQICDDSFAGITAINPRKFAEQLISLRKNKASAPKIVSAPKTTGMEAYETANRFVVVNNKKKKKNK